MRPSSVGVPTSSLSPLTWSEQVDHHRMEICKEMQWEEYQSSPSTAEEKEKLNFTGLTACSGKRKICKRKDFNVNIRLKHKNTFCSWIWTIKNKRWHPKVKNLKTRGATGVFLVSFRILHHRAAACGKHEDLCVQFNDHTSQDFWIFKFSLEVQSSSCYEKVPV